VGVEIKILNNKNHLSIISTYFDEFKNRQYHRLFQHKLKWQELLMKREDWYCIAIVKDYKIMALLPFCMRESHIGKVIISNPYPASYGGVLSINFPTYPLYYKIALYELVEFARNQNVDIITIFTSPFRKDIDLYRRFFKATYEYPKHYQWVSTDYKTNFTGNFRHNWHRAIKNGEANFVYQRTGAYLNDQIFDAWLKIVVDRLGEKNVNRVWLKDVASIGDFHWLEKLGQVAGGSIVIGQEKQDWCQDIYLRVIDTEGITTRYSSIYLDEKVISQFHGVTNFQSSPQKKDSIHEYKRRWGCYEDENYYLIKVLQNEQKFLDVGIDKVKELFPYYFVLPLNCYNK
jgi:hypothetical protein